MRLNNEEQAMLDGKMGEARSWAMDHMLKVGRFFDAQELVPVTQAHIMADTESLGEAGVAFLEKLAILPKADRGVLIPMITDPRGIDFSHYKALGQTEEMASLEQRTIDAFRSFGIMMTDTCINYQTIMPPVRGEHLAFGDTGVVIYCNSVLGARSNFEGGPSALAAGLTGRTPRYGLHLDQNRRATKRYWVRNTPLTLSDWGALGAIVGKLAGSYWEVPAIEGVDLVPGSDALKHLGAAMASFGSIPLFHMIGITPEAPDIDAVCNTREIPYQEVTSEDFEEFYGSYGGAGDKLDVVVFSAPQLSIMELQQLAVLLDGKRVHDNTALLAVTAPSVASDADRFGITRRIEAAGGTLLRGMCFYQSYAREMGLANGWRRLMSNSAKLVNIIGGYGYQPTLASMEKCVESAVAGEVKP